VALLLVALMEVSFLLKLAVLGVLLFAGLVVFYCIARIAAKPRAGAAPEAVVDLLSVPVHQTDMAGALERIEQFVSERSPHMVVTSDSSAVVRAQRDGELHAIFQEADLVTPDGMGVVWAAKVLGLPLWERVSGIDLMQHVCELAAAKGYSIYLLGAAPGVAEAAARELGSRHPGLTVAGTGHGYFSAEEEPEVVARVAQAKPDVLFVAMGIPKQEKWIRRHLAELGVSVAIGVGGSFDVISGRVRRAPRWMRSAGLEWLYRTAREPKRIPRLLAIPRLVWMALRQVVASRRG
jgi:N-acetylglucosaminyldiphosphoundecaprenol N-acetyl-beta-D-mannosaminyltransferase